MLLSLIDVDEEEEAAVNKRRSRKNSDYDDDWMKSRTKNLKGSRGRDSGRGRGGRTPRKMDPSDKSKTTKRKSDSGDKEKPAKKQRTPRKKTSPEGTRKLK